MSRRGQRRRGSTRRPSAAVASYVAGSTSTSNTTDYTISGLNLGADAPDRCFLIWVTQRQNETVDPDGFTLGGQSAIKVASVNGNNINQSLWRVPAGLLPTGGSGTIVIDNPVSRSMCNFQVWRIVGQNSDVPYWANPTVNGGAGTVLDLSPTETFADGATVCGSAAPGSNANYTWVGATEAYDNATESSDCRVGGAGAVGLPAALTATMSGSVTNLMGVAVHVR